MPLPARSSFTIAITADRRRDEQALLLERAGFEVRMFPLLATRAESNEVMSALTEKISAQPPDFLLANTGYGMRTWFVAAAEQGRREALVKALAATTAIVARGAKALGELRRVGLDAVHKVPGETLDEAVQWLLDQGISGRTIVLQLHGEPSDEAAGRLRDAGAEVVTLPIYRVHTGAENVRRALVNVVIEGSVDAVTFTAAPQVQVLWRSAEAGQVPQEFLRAFNERGVVAACIGEVCAGAARAIGIAEPFVPGHPRLGSLANALEALFAGR